MNKKSIYGFAVLLIVIVGILFLATHKTQPEQLTKITDPNMLPGIEMSVAPWWPETNHLRERLDAIGLPALSREGTALHIHQHLDVFVHGKNTPVSAGIGINEIDRFISPIHTHDTRGVIHVESPKIQDFTLGQFFDIWGLRFTQACIGSYCADNTNDLTIFINGKKFSGDFRTITLVAHQEIVIAYGTAQELPQTIPSTYTFVGGE